MIALPWRQGRLFRWLAPLALVAVIAAVYLVVHKTLAPKHKVGATTTSHQTVRVGHEEDRRSAAAGPEVLRRQAGDSLSGIAVKMKLSVAPLERFNPKVNPNSLQTGQRLALQP